MTNYNDGKWHGWNGGERPVHVESIVEGMYLRDDKPTPESPVTDRAGYFDWKYEAENTLIAFRVVKEHREPREFWIMTEKRVLRSYRASKPEVVPFGWECIHVREVTK